MKKIMIFIIFVYMAVMSYTETPVAQVMYKQGDVVSLPGRQYTLDRFLNGEAIWKSAEGALYIVESAKRQGKENYILTEIELDADATAIIKWKSALKIGYELPFRLNVDSELQQVELIQTIEDGKVLERKAYRGGSRGYPVPVTGLIYFHTGDTFNFAGQELTLDQFNNGKGLWKDDNNRLYHVSVAEEKSNHTYMLKEVKGR